MKFEFTPRFRRDYRNLEKKEQRAVTNARTTIKLALEGNVEYSYKHRIKQMEGHPDIWEGHVKDNLCFTFHYHKTDTGEKIVLFRRVGTHAIYKKP
jgi:mRNA-degrading endonuclease YafQ of YafQ-DinJ toxin-antitoxin module